MIKKLLFAAAMLCAYATAQVQVAPIVNPHVTFVNAAGGPCFACTLQTFAAGTTTPQATYTDATGTSQNNNPIVLDASGGANIWLGPNAYKFVLIDSTGTTIWSVDQVPSLKSLLATIQISPSQVTGTAVVQNPSVTQTVTQPVNTNFNVQTSGTGALQHNGNAVVDTVPAAAQTVTQPVNTNVSLITSGTGTVHLASIEHTIYMTPGTAETLAAALVRLETLSAGAGGTIIIPTGIIQSGGFSCTVPNVTLIGSGRPGYNTGFTAMAGGTIIQGTVSASQGCNHFVVKNLGVDVGSAWVAAGNAATDALSIFNNGQVVGATPLDGVLVDNVSCLGSSLSAAFHCMLVENVTNSMIHNVVAILNQHGIILKGTNSHIDGFYSAGHSVDSVIVKSDNYAPSSHDTVSNGSMSYLVTPGDSLGLAIVSDHPGTNFPVQYISVSNVHAYGVANASGGAAFSITGAETFNPATDITLTNLIVDWPGGSPTNVACIQYIQSTARVNISNLNCRNVYEGINYVTPASGFMTDFTLSNSYFQNIQTTGVLTYGTWTITGTEFNTITGNAVLNQVGNTNLAGNTCVACGAYWNNIGGTMQFDYRAYLTNTIPQTNSPGAIGNVEAATSGSLTVSFAHPFNSIVGCQATVLSNAATGSTTVPQVWIIAEDTVHAVFNTSSTSFNGDISWRCEGQLQ